MLRRHTVSLVSFLKVTFQVYSRKLTALILDSAHSHREMISRGIYDRHDPRDDDEEDDDGIESSTGTLPFGDSGQAQLVSVKCHRHREEKQRNDRSTA